MTVKEVVKQIFSKPDLLSMVEKELQEAATALLQAETALEYANSMVAYNTARVNRLKQRLKQLEGN